MYMYRVHFKWRLLLCFTLQGKCYWYFFVFLKGWCCWCFGSTQKYVCSLFIKNALSCQSNCLLTIIFILQDLFQFPSEGSFGHFFSGQTSVHSWEISAGRKDVVCKWLLHFCPKTSFLGNTHHLEITVLCTFTIVYPLSYIENSDGSGIPEIGFSGTRRDHPKNAF